MSRFKEIIDLFFIWGEAHRLGVLKNPSDELVVTAVESLFLDLKKKEIVKPIPTPSL